MQWYPIQHMLYFLLNLYMLLLESFGTICQHVFYNREEPEVTYFYQAGVDHIPRSFSLLYC